MSECSTMSIHGEARKVTTHTLQAMKAAGEKISMLTAYDYSLARLVDDAGIDVILVGDSASNVMAGQVTTVPMTLDHMIYHAQCVVRAVERALIVVDMPFGTYQGNSKLALESAIRIMKESGAHAVKLEGGRRRLPMIEALVDAEIPVMGHLGLTPQSVNVMGGYKVQAKNTKAALDLVSAAKSLVHAGCFSVVLEGVPSPVAGMVTEAIDVATIGIGAGPYCDGQVLVLHDVLGIEQRVLPKFVRRYADLHREGVKALSEFAKDVRTGKFPGDEESYQLHDDVVDEIKLYGTI